MHVAEGRNRAGRRVAEGRNRAARQPGSQARARARACVCVGGGSAEQLNTSVRSMCCAQTYAVEYS